MNTAWKQMESLLMGALCLGGLILAAGCGKKETPAPAGRGELTVMCGAGLRTPIEAIRKQFEQERGCAVRMNYGPGGVLLGQLRVGDDADIFIAGEMTDIAEAEKQGLVVTRRVLGWWKPVVAVAKGNPKGIEGVKDLARSDVRFGAVRDESCHLSTIAKTLFAAEGASSRVKPAYEDLTPMGVAQQLKLKAIDAAILWDAVAKMYPQDFDVMLIPDDDYHAMAFGLGILKGAKEKALAAAFAEFAAGEFGAQAFRDFHCHVSGPTLDVRSGGSMGAPIRDLAKLFEKETGRNVRITLGDSGTLLLETSEAREGDIYVCHDPYALLAKERGMATRWYTVGYLTPVIGVAKGNPKNIQGLKDLLRPDVRTGLPHRQFSTAGQIVWASLKRSGLHEAMDQRKPFESRSSGDLANQLKLGSLDAVVMWDAIARSLPEAVAIVPIEPEHKVDAITSATSSKIFDVHETKVTVVPLVFAKEPLLSAQFAALATSERGRGIWIRHGFVTPPGGIVAP